MTSNEQIDALRNEMHSVLIYFCSEEFDVSTEAAIGVLETVKNDLLNGGTIMFESEIDDE